MTERGALERRAHVRVAGDMTFDLREWGPPGGRPLLALHGFPQCAESWSGLGSLLAEAGVRTVAFDQRGYSPGARPPLDTYTLDAVVEDALRVADELGLERFDLAGFGMGAVQSWQIAATAPERVRSLTALRFPHPRAFAEAVRDDAEQRALWEDLERMSPPVPAARALLADGCSGLREFLLGSGMPPEVTEATVARVGNAPTLEAAIAWHLIPIERMAAVGATTVPALYVWSEGPALTPATAARCGDHVTGPFEVVKLDGTGHWILETAPERLAPPLLAHLLGAEGGGRG